MANSLNHKLYEKILQICNRYPTKLNLRSRKENSIIKKIQLKLRNSDSDKMCLDIFFIWRISEQNQHSITEIKVTKYFFYYIFLQHSFIIIQKKFMKMRCNVNNFFFWYSISFFISIIAATHLYLLYNFRYILVVNPNTPLK